MNVLYVDLESEWRGGQSQALLTLRGLVERGQRVELLAVREGALSHRAQAGGIRTHTVGSQARQLQAAVRLRRLLARSKFDVLHANEPHALTAAWLARAHRRLPVVVSRRVAYRLSNHPLARARYHAARRVLAISRFVAESVIASGVPARQVEIAYEGVEVPPPLAPEARRRARERWGIEENEVLLGCVGYLLPEKGQEFLLRALASLRAEFPNCRLLLAGDGPCRDRLERLAKELRLGPGVCFAGFVEEVPQVYAALDVFVFPSLAEPLGTSLLAAMAYGLPVVAVASGGVPEYVEDGRSGLLISGADLASHPKEIAERIAQLLRDAGLANQMGQAARETILQGFTAEHMVATTLRIYGQLRGSPP